MSLHLWIAIVFTILTALQLILLGIVFFVPKLFDKIGSWTFLVILVFMVLQFLSSIGYLIYNIIGG